MTKLDDARQHVADAKYPAGLKRVAELVDPQAFRQETISSV